MSITLLLLIAAALCFALSALGVSSRINLQSLGLLFWILTLII